MDDGQPAVMTTADDPAADLDLTPPPGDWAAQAACAGGEVPDQFFPETDDGSERAALRVCAGCPVRVPCLHHALIARERHGVWGGMTAAERDVLLYGDPSTLRRGRVA